MGAKFTVDTHVFRELGELLVGRDSTALIELIKNAYDADALEVTVYGESLNDADEGYILISDDGVGMTRTQFEEGFLRIAARGKEIGDRRSLRFQRRFTGAKGIGRLAAHKLARLLSVSSIPAKELGSATGVDARIDWDKVEKYSTLEDLGEKGSDAIIVESKRNGAGKSGTEIRLERLRKSWSPNERLRFISEVQSFSPPSFLVEPDRSVIRPYAFLFDRTVLADRKKNAPFQATLQGEFTPTEDYWKIFTETADWFVEVDAVGDSDNVRFQLTPTKQFRREFPEAKMIRHTIPHPGSHHVPRFQARFIVREGPQGRGNLKTWAASNYGIRVYMEGFRVLPYGEKSNDWLHLDRNYAERTRSSEYLKRFGFVPGEKDRDELLTHLPNRSYYGAVFLTQEGAPSLRMLVNREGFVPDDSWDSLVDFLRLGIDLTTRARAASKAHRRMTSSSRTEVPTDIDRGATVRTSFASLLLKVNRARTAFAAGDLNAARTNLVEAENSIKTLSETTSSEASMLRVLASVGSQMAAFVHEINATLGMAEAIETSLAGIETPSLTQKQRKELAGIQKSVSDLRRQLERQATYLTDVVTMDARRRRVRNPLANRFDAAVRLVSRTAERREIKIENRIPETLKSPPMFPAEITTVFSNLLTNAIKAAGRNGRIRATGRDAANGEVHVRIENTGIEVHLADADKWFLPFESTTTDIDAGLGQGMGLGLPITRNMLEQYGATVTFVAPNNGFSTALEIVFPAKG
jgi:signal transduction histidine kinase